MESTTTKLLSSASGSGSLKTEKSSNFKLKTYLTALRAHSLSASLVPTILGSTLAYRSEWSSNYSPAISLLTLFTVVTVHCAGNVVNTYFDFVKGIDNRKSDDRILVDNILTKDEVCILIFFSVKLSML